MNTREIKLREVLNLLTTKTRVTLVLENDIRVTKTVLEFLEDNKELLDIPIYKIDLRKSEIVLGADSPNNVNIELYDGII